MIIGIPKETFPCERRVAMIPAQIPTLTQSELEVIVQSEAGKSAGNADFEYQDKGGRIVGSRKEVFDEADIILQVRTPGANPDIGKADLDLLHSGHTLIGFCEPFAQGEILPSLASRGVSLFSIELLPRTTRAQSMDALSSMATISGYKAVLLAANHLPRMFPMLMTAAGTVAPARVLVIGAGVAGLQAIATANRLGAVVQAYDVRPAVKEQVESLGAKFVELPLEAEGAEDKGGYSTDLGEVFYQKQQELMGQVISESDVVISTAAVPGKKAPTLITNEMVEGMPPGSIIIDLAAERGGNCELTQPEQNIVKHEVTIMGVMNLPSTIPCHASQMYAKNLSTFLLHLVKEGQMVVDLDDEITRETLVAQKGEIVHPRVREALGLSGEHAGEGDNS